MGLGSYEPPVQCKMHPDDVITFQYSVFEKEKTKHRQKGCTAEGTIIQCLIVKYKEQIKRKKYTHSMKTVNEAV